MGTCYVQRIVLARFLFSIVGGWEWEGYRALSHLRPPGGCSERTAAGPERDLGPLTLSNPNNRQQSEQGPLLALMTSLF